LIIALMALVLTGGPALAHGHGGHGGHGGHAHGHAGGFHGGGFHRHEFFAHHAVIFGPAFGYPYYNPYYYDYPGTWAPDAGPYVVPSPLYAAPSPGQCRTFAGDALVTGTNQPFYGSACLQPDGQWHVVP
jgi:hypothetical protein